VEAVREVQCPDQRVGLIFLPEDGTPVLKNVYMMLYGLLIKEILRSGDRAT